eukprot:TRINITY_DN16169_c0_g1_i3.p1 TRINITY_DN16169_c0_g1~~TRINITY_DN16169_c0_g1_i3.p1  ORF type:complete len:336 (+),score=71.35 TRINITY_DN16169_c0_g1_i3:256-1263(+)
MSSVAVAGSHHGWLGTIAGLAVGGGLCASNNMKQRGVLCFTLFAMAVTADSPYRKVVATVAASVASLMAWLCKGGRKDFARNPALKEFITKHCADYYEQAELRGDLKSIQQGKSCFAFHPHGCLSAGWSINATFSEHFAKAAGRVIFLCDYNLRYKNPGFRWLCDATKSEEMEIDSADKKNIVRVMDRGDSFAIIPGGFQDAVVHAYGKDATVLKKRKGFIKYCLQFGYRVHPVYTFGESETFHTFTGLKKLRTKVSEQNIPMVAFFGWPLFPLLPRPQSKLLTYVGPPLQVPHIAAPTVEDVDQWHTAYMEALTKLFNDKKAEAGYPDAVLEIV